MSFNFLTTFSLSSLFVAQSNSFIKLLKFLLLLYSLNSLSSMSSIYSNSLFPFSSFLVLVLFFFVFFHFYFHLLMTLMFRHFPFPFPYHFYFYFWLSDFNVLSVKVKSNNSLNKLNNAFCLEVLFFCFIIPTFFYFVLCI